jgi:hypothetical protein
VAHSAAVRHRDRHRDSLPVSLSTQPEAGPGIIIIQVTSIITGTGVTDSESRPGGDRDSADSCNLKITIYYQVLVLVVECHCQSR